MYLRHFKIAQARGIYSHELHKFHATFIRIKNTTKSSQKMTSDLMNTEPGGENTQ